jgi:multiple sugar transport system ATP-binding protein
MAGVRFQNVTKRYGAVSIIEGLDLDIHDREFMVLVGPSGCGKSTALRMIAGLEEVSSGSVYIGDRVVNELHPKDRDVAMVFQTYALYPHMTVRQNIAFGLTIRKTPKPLMEQKVADAARTLGIEPLLDRKPKQLSGGQRQRVAVARAIVRDPKVCLFDEPLSNLDAKLRVQMRAEITKLQQHLGTTCIYVTHDQIEAMTMGHRLAVMKEGKIQQIGTPLEVYEKPATLFVAQFIGTPPMNLFRAVAHDGRVDAAGFTLPLPEGRRVANGENVWVGIRPENLRPAHEPGRGATAHIEGTVDLVEPIGHQAIVHARFGDDVLVAAFDAYQMPKVNEPISFAVAIDAMHLFDAVSEKRLM